MPITNPYAYNEGYPDGPAKDAVAMGAGSDTELTKVARGFMVGVAGNVKVTTLAGNDVTIPCIAGCVVPLLVTKIWATGTTATGITAFRD